MMNLSQEEAKLFFAHGAVLIIAGVPIGTEFGMDLSSYSVAERFRGVKMIPPGPHYVYTAAQGPYGDSSSRVGFMHYFKSQEVVVREWDAEKEELRLRQITDPDTEIQRIKENLMELDRYLAPYDYADFGKWKNITRHVTEQTILSISPECGLIKSSVEFESCPDSERPKGNTSRIRLSLKSHQTEDDLLPNLKVVQITALRFTEIPSRHPVNATPAEITASYMDSYAAIQSLIDSYKNPDQLIDEIEFSFGVFLSGYSVDALGHWRRLLNLLANSQKSVDKYPQFYVDYMAVLQHQLPELPEELMEPTQNNSVYKDVQQLIANCGCCGLKKRADILADSLLKSMSWSFDGIYDEDPDDLPVVVEI